RRGCRSDLLPPARCGECEASALARWAALETIGDLGPNGIHVEGCDQSPIGLLDADVDFLTQFFQLPGAEAISIVEELKRLAEDFVDRSVEPALDLRSDDVLKLRGEGHVHRSAPQSRARSAIIPGRRLFRDCCGVFQGYGRRAARARLPDDG